MKNREGRNVLIAAACFVLASAFMMCRTTLVFTALASTSIELGGGRKSFAPPDSTKCFDASLCLTKGPVERHDGAANVKSGPVEWGNLIVRLLLPAAGPSRAP